MTKSGMVGASMVLFAVMGSTAEAKLYKWVDDRGETHYGEVVPPEYASREKIQIEKGQVVKKKASDTNPEARTGRMTNEERAAQDATRRDNALLSTYSSEKEIDLARDRNLQQVEARVNSAELRLKAAQETLDGHLKEKAKLEKGNKSIPQSLLDDIANDQAKVAKVQQELTRSREEATAVRARYEADRTRYLELTGAAGQKP